MACLVTRRASVLRVVRQLAAPVCLGRAAWQMAHVPLQTYPPVNRPSLTLANPTARALASGSIQRCCLARARVQQAVRGGVRSVVFARCCLLASGFRWGRSSFGFDADDTKCLSRRRGPGDKEPLRGLPEQTQSLVEVRAPRSFACPHSTLQTTQSPPRRRGRHGPFTTHAQFSPLGSVWYTRYTSPLFGFKFIALFVAHWGVSVTERLRLSLQVDERKPPVLTATVPRPRPSPASPRPRPRPRRRPATGGGAPADGGGAVGAARGGAAAVAGARAGGGARGAQRAAGRAGNTRPLPTST